MKKVVPDGEVIGGLQSSQCGRTLTFKAASRDKYIQILHVTGNHWITVSNINVQNVAVFDEAFVYDSMLPSRLDSHTRKQICSLAKPSCKTLTFNIVNIMAQINSYDCGLHAIANATELIYGRDPAKCLWDTERMRSHLLACLECGLMEGFPTTRQRRIPFGRRVKTSFTEDVHCVCRMPYFDQDPDCPPMIECSSCSVWFHGQCLDVDVKEYESKTWMCKECEPLYRE